MRYPDEEVEPDRKKACGDYSAGLEVNLSSAMEQAA
jgi:hypothetical protein